MVERLLCKCKALSSNTNPPHTQTKIHSQKINGIKLFYADKKFIKRSDIVRGAINDRGVSILSERGNLETNM
jgi:hypothetical protein